MTRRVALSVLAILLLAASALILAHPISSRTIESVSADSIARWRAGIEHSGGKAAYGELVCALKDQDETAVHVEAHNFGAALYLQEGMRGLPVCGDEFNYGCLHEFYGRAIADKGLGVIRQLESACDSLSDANSVRMCEHGIGHGLIAYFGYDRESRDRSVAACNELGDASAASCQSGVFMEYLNRTMLGDNDFALSLDDDNKYALCDGLGDRDKPYCIFELPRQWRKNLFLNAATTTAALQRIGQLCGVYKDSPEFYTACFKGLGNDVFILSHHDVATATRSCKEASADPRARSYCIEQVEGLARHYSEDSAALQCGSAS